MTSSTSSSTTATTDSTASRTGILATAGLAIGVVYAALISFTDDDPHRMRQFLVLLGIVVVTTVITFAVVRAATARADVAPAVRTTVVLAVLALLSVAAFWACLWAPLIAGSICAALAVRERRHGAWGRGPAVALVLDAVAVVLVGLAAVFG
ncbi:MAG TPA: hypothetical protein VH857_07485 [Actinomycetes bacterium]|jgi:hypothetical protein|nr:hypothetical protein [Actinomycetes bacterium]